MAEYLRFYLVLFLKINSFIVTAYTDVDDNDLEPKHETRDFVFWPNATIPFYIDPAHFDNEQALSIMTSLSLFAYKTCLKFAPVLARPNANEHVMVFENPKGVRQCTINTEGHSIDEPHLITLGYQCLKTPNIEMMVMNALGYPFEHNRAIRNLYIDVQHENIEPGNMELFTIESKLPEELRVLPYDVNSVLHFDERAFSKNGHRTIIFKDHKTKQCRNGLSDLDIKKIGIVYGPECLARDRQEKIEICQNYPGVARRKREASSEVTVDATKSLRVNPDITAPPNINNNTDGHIGVDIKDLGIENEIQSIIDQVNKVSSLALKNARVKYCNDTKSALRTINDIKKGTDILGIVTAISDYAQHIVDSAVGNLTEFCESSETLDKYQRIRCPFFDPSRCVKSNYRSTKSGPVKYSTQHRPLIRQSTKHEGSDSKKRNNAFVSQYRRDDNSTLVELSERRKRDIENIGSEDLNGNEDSSKQTVERYKRDTDVSPKDLKDSVSEVTVIDETVSPNGKSDLRMGNTPRPTVKRVVYAPDDRRYMEGRRFRQRKHKVASKDVEVWGDSSVSSEKKKKSEENTAGSSEESPRPIQSKEERFPPAEVQYIEMPAPSSPQKTNYEGRDEEESSNDSSPSGDFVPVTVELSKKNKEFYNDRKWDDGLLVYMIQEDPTYDMADIRARLGAVKKILKEKTCVRMKEIRESDVNKYEDYLVLDNSPDFVTGRVGGRQKFGVVELLRGGQHKQHTAMMVMAMLGFYLEVSRHDRDKYIRVHNRHIRADKLHHFEKIRSDATFDLPYDYKSAMHPAWQFWRHIGRTGISTVATYKEKDPDGSIMKSLGQNDNLLSDLDIIKINSVYGIKCFRPKSPKKRKAKRNNKRNFVN